MSEHHTAAVFNNSCLKVPSHPKTKKPYPIYDQKLINQIENQTRKLGIQCKKDKEELKSFIEFYDSIPEYDDVNHLSNREFYKKLHNLKEKQRAYFDYLDHEISLEKAGKTGWIDEYKKLNSGNTDIDLDSTSSSEKCVLRTPCTKSKKSSSANRVKNYYKNKHENFERKSMLRKHEDLPLGKTEDFELFYALDNAKPPSRRSVRIESPPEIFFEDDFDGDFFRSKSRNEKSSDGFNKTRDKGEYRRSKSSAGDFKSGSRNNGDLYKSNLTKTGYSENNVDFLYKEKRNLSNTDASFSKAKTVHSDFSKNRIDSSKTTSTDHDANFFDREHCYKTKTRNDSDLSNRDIKSRTDICSTNNDLISSDGDDFRAKSKTGFSSSKTANDLNFSDGEFFRSKSRAGISSAGSKITKTASNDDFSDLDGEKEETLTTKSTPCSPRKEMLSWKDCGITIPKPFQMTVRDEENHIVEELIIKNKEPDDDQQHQMFRANPVPIESQIPLFDKVMYDQEKRRQLVKKKSKEALKAQMRPFSFTKREEELQEITKRLTKSSPNIFFYEEKPQKVKKFKAKPVPKNLFSNYIYRKMHEDEFYRALQRKIRSEEMLKAASLPPSMAKREKHKPKFHICPRSFRDLGDTEDGSYRLKTGANKQKYSDLEKELAELELDFIMSTPSPNPMKSKRKKGKKKGRKSSSANSKNSMRCQSALESVNRSNLAAVLRIEAAKKRMEDEISRRLEQAHIKEEARWREKVLRKKPIWETLAYSHEEDLNMRLQLRRDEERLRKEEHKMRMQTMIAKVQQQPTLFERQSQAKFAKTREELIEKLYKNSRGINSASYSENSDQRSVIEMKDEAIQAHFDEMFKKEEEAALHGDNDENKTNEA